MSEVKKSIKNKVQQIDPANKANKKLYLPVKNKTNLSTNQKKTKARYQVGNRAMKTKLTNMLRGKDRKKEQILKVKQRQIKKIYIH